jgi:hypothetical protein
MEALTMVDMIAQHVIPAVKKAGVGPLTELEVSVVVRSPEGAAAQTHFTLSRAVVWS